MQILRIAPIVLSFSLAACTHGLRSGDAPTSPGTLTFVHLNDTYRIDAVEEGASGGFGRVATIVRELNGEDRDVRITQGGDFLYPSLESQLWDGMQIIEVFNFLDSLAPMYAVPGNHEFDPREPAAVIEAVRKSEFDWLGDNVKLETGAGDVDRRLESGFTFTAGGRKVGVFALTLHADDGGNQRDYAPVDKDYLEAAKKALAALQRQGVDLIVGLTHLHVETDLEIARLKADYPNFLFILGGHEHEPEFHAGDDRAAAVIKGASNARTIWQVDVNFDNAGGAPRFLPTKIQVNESIVEDREYNLIRDKWRAQLLERMPYLESTIGYAAVPLDAREVTVRNGESNWGNFIADQMRVAFAGKRADLAFVNSGTLRIDDWIANDVTFEDIGRTFGFSSYLRYMTMTGGDFRDLLEAGYRGEGPSKGYFPQISGFRVCVDRSRPVGERIVQLQVPVDPGWGEIDADAEYRLVAPDFLYGGGDGYDFNAARDVSRPGSELKYLVVDAIMRAQADGDEIGTPVDPANPRIAMLRGGESHCFE
jgi:5'-nucleotidase